MNPVSPHRSGLSKPKGAPVSSATSGSLGHWASRTACLVLAGVPLLGLVGCGDSSHAKDVRAKFSSAFESLSDWTFEAKDQVANKVSDLAEASGKEIERLEQLIQEKGPEAKAALEKKLEALKARRGELVEQLDRAREAGAESWEAASEKLKAAAQGLNEAYENATSDK